MAVDREYKIKIITEAESAGTRQSVQGLEEVKAKTGEVSKAGQDLLRGLKQLGNEFPLIGQAARLAMNPVIGAFVIITAAVAATRNAFQRLAEEQERLGEIGAEGFGDMAETLDELGGSAQHLQEEFGKYLDLVDTRAKQASDLIKSHVEAVKQLLEAEKNLALARAKTPEEKAAITESFRQQEARVDLAEQERLLREAEATMSDRTRERGSVEADLRFKAGGRTREEILAELTDIPKRISSAKGAREKISPYDPWATGTAFREWQGISTDATAGGIRDSLTRYVEGLKEQRTRLRAALQELNVLDDLNKKISELNSNIAQRKVGLGASRTATGLGAATGVAAGAVDVGGMIQQMLDTIRRAQAGKGATPDQAVAVKQFQVFLDNLQFNGNQFIEQLNRLIANGMTNQQATAAAIKAINAKIAQLERAAAGQRNSR